MSDFNKEKMQELRLAHLTSKLNELLEEAQTLYGIASVVQDLLDETTNVEQDDGGKVLVRTEIIVALQKAIDNHGMFLMKLLEAGQ